MSNYSPDAVMARLIQLYVLHHQGCTVKEIEQYFVEHDFGLGKSYTRMKISRLIRTYINLFENSDTAYRWFYVRGSTTSPKKYYCKKV